MDKDGLDLLRKLLAFNPENRYSVDEALNHPYLKDFHDPSEEIEFNGFVKIPVDENTKYSIREYREMLYMEMAPSKHRHQTEARTSLTKNSQQF